MANDWREQNMANSDEYPLTVGPWHHIEVVWRMNDIGSANGEIHVWVDGEKYIESLNIEYRSSSYPVGFFRHHGDMIFGGDAGEVVSEDTRFQFDHLYISGVSQ